MVLIEQYNIVHKIFKYLCTMLCFLLKQRVGYLFIYMFDGYWWYADQVLKFLHVTYKTGSFIYLSCTCVIIASTFWDLNDLIRYQSDWLYLLSIVDLLDSMLEIYGRFSQTIIILPFVIKSLFIHSWVQFNCGGKLNCGINEKHAAYTT
jgi:hypothetical protein